MRGKTGDGSLSCLLFPSGCDRPPTIKGHRPGAYQAVNRCLLILRANLPRRTRAAAQEEPSRLSSSRHLVSSRRHNGSQPDMPPGGGLLWWAVYHNRKGKVGRDREPSPVLKRRALKERGSGGCRVPVAPVWQRPERRQEGGLRNSEQSSPPVLWSSRAPSQKGARASLVTRYSVRSAVTGSFRAAFPAGINPAITVSTILRMMSIAALCGGREALIESVSA